MHTTLLSAALAPFLLALWPSGADELAPGELVEGELGLQLDEHLTRLEGLGFAGVVGVELEGEPILIRGYGLADRARGRPVTPDTVFTVGSITKPFTAVAVLALVDEGKLAVQDPLAKFVEGLPEAKRGITLHHLLTHTSGLADPIVDDFDPRATAEWIRAWVASSPLEWQPGAEYGYRNVNYSLLGLVIERASGMPYEEFLAQRLFRPAGMTRTGYLLPRFAPEELAVGYRDGDRWGTLFERPWLADGPSWTLRANGGIHSTVGDMLRFHHALTEGGLVSDAARAALETPHVPEGGGTFYGYGWSIEHTLGGKLVAHNGGNRTFFADFLRFVEEGHVVFLATNVASRTSPSLAYDLAAILRGRPARELPETLPRDRAWLARYAGRYALGEEAWLELENQGDRLALCGHGAAAAELLLDPGVRERVERMRPVAAALAAGEERAALEARLGRPMPDAVADELRAARARWARELGTFRGLGAVETRTGKHATLLFEARFERGRGWIELGFGPSGGLAGCRALDSAPFEGPQRVELFPLSPAEFRAYDERTGLGLRVDFELDAEGRATALALGTPPVRAPRAE